MYTVIVTGGLASGKSALTQILCKKGAISLNLDAVAHSLLDSNEAMVAELAKRFGNDILDGSGSVIRPVLASRAFESEQATQDLNDITHPYILEIAADAILGSSCSKMSDAVCQVIEVALLDKCPDFAKLADEVIAVEAAPDIRIKRAIERGMNEEDAAKRMQAQASDEQRKQLADTICVNNGTYEDLKIWADNWWNSRFAVLDFG